jgi:hypothetical protein
MEYSLSNSLVGGSKSLNPFGLSLDLQFAADKSLTARKGPTPTFTRASTATYYGPLIEVSGNVLEPIGFSAGRVEWQVGNINTDYISVYYNSTHWRVFTFFSNESNVYDAAVGNEFRPDEADWSAVTFYVEVTTSGIFRLLPAAGDEPRFDHDPATSLCKGLLIEESRTNIVFPSDNLTTQTRTVTATPHTLSFYGSGTVVLSGAQEATIIGTGAYPTRTTLTFTPTAGSLILTVTGSVTQAQLEAGAFVTSYIPTAWASVVRSTDVCTITGTDFNTIYNQPEHSLFAEASAMSHASFGPYLSFDNGTTTEQSILAGFPSPNSINCYEVDNAVPQAQVGKNITLNQNNKMAAGMKLNSFQLALNNTLGTEDTSGTMSTANILRIGKNSSGATISGTYAQIKVFKKRLANAKLQALTT